MLILDANQTARALPWDRLVTALQRTLADHAAGSVHPPERWVLPVAPGTSWFLMPAWLAPEAGDLAAIKLITYAAANAARGLPAILGDVLVMRASIGERLALLDGPTVTARRLRGRDRRLHADDDRTGACADPPTGRQRRGGDRQ